MKLVMKGVTYIVYMIIGDTINDQRSIFLMESNTECDIQLMDMYAANTNNGYHVHLISSNFSDEPN